MSENEMDLPEGFGTANYSNQKYETWKLKDDSSLVLRILPPMKSLRKRGDIGLYWKTHFGWNGRDSQNPTKARFRPFLCIEERRDGMTTETCPACDLRKSYEDKMNAKKAKGKELGKTEAEIRKATANEYQWLRDHGLDGKFRIPAINKSGQLGFFLCPYGLVKKLREELKRFTAKGIDPTGRKGVWFEFTRSGKASPTSDSVRPVRVTKVKDGEEVEVLDVHVISNEDLTKALEVLPDLNELMEKGRIRRDQIEALVALAKSSEGACDPDEVDRILVDRILEVNKREDSKSSASSDDWSEVDEAKSSKSAPAPVGDDDFDAPAPAKTAPAPAATAAEDDEEAELERKLAAKRADKAAKAKAAAAATTKAPPATKPLETEEDLDSIFAEEAGA